MTEMMKLTRMNNDIILKETYMEISDKEQRFPLQIIPDTMLKEDKDTKLGVPKAESAPALVVEAAKVYAPTVEQKSDAEYIKILKQALFEAITENDILRKRVTELENQFSEISAEKEARDRTIIELMQAQGVSSASQTQSLMHSADDSKQAQRPSTTRKSRRRRGKN